MSRLPSGWLSRPLNIASFVFGAVTAAANLCVAALVTGRLLRSSSGAWRMLAVLGILNIMSAILQIVLCYLTYWGFHPILYWFERASIGVLFLAFAWIQLELRFVFAVLFETRVEKVWTPAARNRARVGLVILHLVLMWGQYFSAAPYLGYVFIIVGVASAARAHADADPHTASQMFNVGVGLHATIFTFVAGIQAYLIIRALLRSSKKISTIDSIGYRRSLITLLCVSVVIQVVGISVHIFRSLFLKITDDAALSLYWVIYQFTIACISCEAVIESLSLMNMTDLVAGRPKSISAKWFAKKTSRLARTTSPLKPSHDAESSASRVQSIPQNTVAAPAIIRNEPDRTPTYSTDDEWRLL
nr:hypothetical protein HK105_000774 [Polyrhizophydium stewartii]